MNVNKNRNGRTMAQTVHLRGCPSGVASQYLAPMSMTSLGQIGVLKGMYTVCHSVLYARDCAWCLAVIPSHFAALNWMCPLSARKPNLFKSC